MEVECAPPSNVDVPITITGSFVETKRKSKATVKCFCDKNVSTYKKKSKNDRKIRDLELNAIASKVIKPCTVNLMRVEPLITNIITKNSSSKFLVIENKKSIDLNNEEHNDSLMSIKSTNTLKKRIKNKSLKSDLMETLKSCSVVLKRSNLNDFSEDFVPTIYFPTGQVDLKPCSVKLPIMNIQEARTSVSHSLDVIKPCIVKLERIDAEIFSSFNGCVDEKIDNLDGTVSKEKHELLTSLALKKESQNCHSSYRGKITWHEGNSQNSFENFYLKSNDDKSDLSEVSDNHASEIYCSKREKQSLTTRLKNFDSSIEKYLEYDSNNSHPVQELQNTFQQFSPPSDLETKSKKAYGSLSFEILKDKTISYLAGNDLKLNESSGLMSAIEPCFKPDEEDGVQCEIQTSKNDMHHCCQCSKALPSLKSFYYHVCHGKQKRGYPCKFCEKNFDFFHALRKHKKSHALRNSLSCSDTVKSRHGKNIGKANHEIKKKVRNTPSKTIAITDNKNMKNGHKGKENSSYPKLKPKQLKAKIFLRNASDATTSSGCYSADINFLQNISYPDDSEVD